MVALVSVGIGAFLIERFTRPGEDGGPPPGTHISPAPPQAPLADVSPPPPANTEDLIAEAKEMADRLAAAFPADPESLCLAGRIQHSFGSSVRATACWQRCLELAPQRAEARAALGVVAWQQGDFSKAVAYLEQAIAVEPRLLGENVFCLVDSLLNLGRAKDAVDLLENAAKTTRLSVPGLVVLGQAYLQLKDYAKAKERFEAALAEEPRLAQAHYGLANALFHLGRPEEAQTHRDLYVRWKQEELAIWDRMHGAGRKMEKVDPAEVRGIVARFNAEVGHVYASRGKADEAAGHYRRALALEEDAETRRQLEALTGAEGRSGQ